MLNKEEYTPIELRKHCIKTMQFSNRDSSAYKEHELILSIMDENISMKYKLDQLESDKQKLIEILEKANKEDTNTVKYYEKQRRLTTDDFYKKSYQTQIHKANARREVRKHILEIVKGEEK